MGKNKSIGRPASSISRDGKPFLKTEYQRSWMGKGSIIFNSRGGDLEAL